MRDDIKCILHDMFQMLIVISVPFILMFYWPSHELRLMKFICFQSFTMILLGMSFIFAPKRIIDNFFPALFLILGFFNLFTHGMADFVNIGMGFVLPAIIGIYVISNHMSVDIVPLLKRIIVITCLLNCVLFIAEVAGLNPVFDLQALNKAPMFIHTRPAGFMCYPINFSLLCAVSLFLAWEWEKWLALPIGICLILSGEYAVIFGTLFAISMFYLKGYWRLVLPVLALIAGIVLWNRAYGDIATISHKIEMRTRFLYPVFQNSWARPIDGWGLGAFRQLPDKFFGFPKGNWSELHCEPLDLFFSMGIIGLMCVLGWIYKVRKAPVQYKIFFTIFGITSCFHSPFHFADTLYLFVILYCLYEVENYESA